MSRIPVPTYITTEDYNVNKGESTKKLEKGSFVKPIDYYYVPQHVREENRHWYNSETQMFVYCHYGIVTVPKKIVRRV